VILFTADWHIKLGQKNVPKKWALDRYISFFEQVHAIECDEHIIGGDIFDRVPSMEELALYWAFIAGVETPTTIFDGNHEATRKNKTFFSYLDHATSLVNPLVEIVDTYNRRADYGILPYCELHKSGSIEIMDATKPLFTHVRGEIPPHVKPEVDLDRFNDFPVVFAGDLHAHSNTQRNIVYPGSPMTTSFHRNKVETGYILIDENTWDWTWYPFELPQLLRRTVNTAEEMIATDYDHTIYEIEGDVQQLSLIENSELLDKKVIKRNSEATLILAKDMPIDEELAEYLLYILEIPEEQVKNLVATFHDYCRGNK